MQKIISFLGCFFSLAALILPGQSFALDNVAQTDKVKVEVLPAFSAIESGQPLDILVKVTPQNGWHIYWDNPGDAGLPTTIVWNLPKHATMTELGHSAPKKYDADGLVLYGYGNSAYWKYRLSLNNWDNVRLKAKVSWLACREECVPETVLLNFKLPVVAKRHHIHPDNFWQNEALKAENSFPSLWKGASFYEIRNNQLLLRLNAGFKNLFDKAQNVWFVPYQRDVIDNVAKPYLGQDDEGNYSLLIPVIDVPDKDISGLLLIEKSNTQKVYEIHPMKASGLRTLPPINEMQQSLLGILVMAFIGGIILNFMPCIFPILSIKAIALVQGAYNKRRARIEAVFYVLGVVVCFVVMASILIALRLQGEHIGWGFQLQSPAFVACMIVIFFIVFLMLLDLVNLKNPFANRVGRISFAKQKVNAFFTGLFAVLIASPCTAPFMGIAIGYTLSKPIYIYYPIFVALSLGYALPFALIAFFPRVLLRILPKPGKWMSVLKKIFAIPVLLTCFWLSWVLWHLLGNENVVENNLKWMPYEPQAISSALQKNQPVFVDFTAKWCITCLANEKIALDSPEFIKMVNQKGIKLFKADWTNKSPEIADALAQYGRNSVPLYVYYPNSGDYVILPQLLTAGILEEYLK